MEGNCGAEAEPLLVGNIYELTRSNSDATTASLDSDQNREDILLPSEDVMPDDEQEWTDEKHNLYLHCLEVSFVKQLHQSKRMLAHCSRKKQRGISNSEKQLINARNTSEQFNVLWNCCWHKINGAMCEPLSSRISVDSSPLMSNKGIYDISSTCMLGTPPSFDMPEFLKFCSLMKYAKRVVFRGLETPPEEFSPNKPSPEYLLHSITEGMGQNFSDEGNKKLPNYESQAKRLKTVTSSDSSTQDQITPSKN